MRILIIVLLTAVAGLVLMAGGPGRDGPGDADRATNDFEEVVFVDYGVPFHGGPGPHEATADEDDFRLTMGGIKWNAITTVNYVIEDDGCGDCDNAVGAINVGFNTWEALTGRTFTSGSSGTNLCTGTGNLVSWEPIDGEGDVLAVASVCRNVATKEIVGFTVTFDSGDSWSATGSPGSNEFDVQSVMTHEAGHVIGLAHVNPPRDAKLTMFPTIAAGNTDPRSLGCGDILGAEELYGDPDVCPPNLDD